MNKTMPTSTAATTSSRVAPLEIIETTEHTVCCNGAGHNNLTPHLGHPAVYLTFKDSKEVDCPYCGRRFVFTGSQHAAH